MIPFGSFAKDLLIEYIEERDKNNINSDLLFVTKKEKNS